MNDNIHPLNPRERAYTQADARVRAALAELRVRLNDKAKAARASNSWGHVGDVNRLAERLEEILEVFR